MRVLVLGDGLLASEVVRQTGWDYMSRKKDGLDYTKGPRNIILTISPDIPLVQISEYDVIVNLIACTDTYLEDKDLMKKVNFDAVKTLVDYCNNTGTKLVHYSTDYVYANSKSNASEEDLPCPAKNWYSYYKLLADEYVKENSENYLICRGSQKPKPFPYVKAWENQFGNFDYVDVIASIFIKMIKAGASGLYNIGTPTKTIWKLASETSESVEKALAPRNFPLDTTMDLTKMNKFLINEERNQT